MTLLICTLAALIASDEASLASNLLTLKGNVSISHPLGHFEAQEVLVEKAPNDETKLSHAFLEKAVKISLSESRIVECDKADVDFNKLSATLNAEEDHLVQISDLKQDVCLKAKNVECHFSSEKGKNIQTISGKTNVELSIGNLYQIFAEKVQYLSDGTLHFFSDQEGGSCTVKTPKDTFIATKISYDTESKTFALDDLGAVIHGYRLQAKHTLFSREENKITLDQGARIEHPELGFAAVPGIVELFLDKEQRITQFALTGTENSPIDFTNETLHLSAEKLIIAFDQETGKSSVKGEGVVKVTLPTKLNWKEDLVTTLIPLPLT
ncbi:MAG: hypothetical protein FJZ56_00470 [Chlamydiae bacterium]|nr:hypothetical protein [Chlamydiota bacterium]